MAVDDENKDKSQDDIGELLRKYYKPEKELDPESFVKNVSRKIDSLFHKEIFSDTLTDSDNNNLSEEERYWLGIEEYIRNEVSSLKHKAITDHLLICKECRHNYNLLLDKKKVIKELALII